MFVSTHPLHAHRLPHGARQQGGIACRIFVAVAAIAAGAFNIDRAHLVFRQRHHGCKLLAQIVGRLTCRPAGQHSVAEFGYGAGRPDRAVRMDGEVVGRGQTIRRLRQRLFRVADVAGDVVLDDAGGAHMLPEPGLIRQP